MPLHVGDVTTINEPLLVRATALIVPFPNFAVRTFLHVAELAVLLLKVLFFARAQRETCVALHVWMTAPLLIQLLNVFSVAVEGRPKEALPLVWLHSVLKELILFSKVVQQPL